MHNAKPISVNVPTRTQLRCAFLQQTLQSHPPSSSRASGLPTADVCQRVEVAEQPLVRHGHHNGPVDPVRRA
eukprot:11172104-Lingulodinium_polyedra.AAC.1